MKSALIAASCLLGLALMAACGGGSDDDPTADEEQELGTRTSKVRVTTNPSPVIVGAPATLNVRVTGVGGAAITSFEPLHTQTMHLIAVSSDLEDFIHVHPVLRATGDLSVSATFSRSEPYAIFMEYDPAGPAGATLGRARVSPSGARVVKPQLRKSEAFDGSTSKTVTAGGTAVEVLEVPGGMIMANEPTHLVFNFQDATGSPISDLTNWLGMPAHGIIVSPDLKTFRHVHGMAEAAGGGGHHGPTVASTKTGPVAIDVSLPKAGLYKLFLQFKRGSTVVTAPFVLDVMPSHGRTSPPPSCATMTCPSGQHCMVMGAPPAPMCM